MSGTLRFSPFSDRFGAACKSCGLLPNESPCGVFLCLFTAPVPSNSNLGDPPCRHLVVSLFPFPLGRSPLWVARCLFFGQRPPKQTLGCFCASSPLPFLLTWATLLVGTWLVHSFLLVGTWLFHSKMLGTLRCFCRRVRLRIELSAAMVPCSFRVPVFLRFVMMQNRFQTLCFCGRVSVVSVLPVMPADILATSLLRIAIMQNQAFSSARAAGPNSRKLQ